MSQVIISNLNKTIKHHDILKNISYKFENKRIYGIYGRNGSGKTMLLRAIAGLIFPTSGTIEIDGKIMHKDIGFPDDIGILIENMSLPGQYDALTNLEILAKIKGRLKEEDLINALEMVGLDPLNKKKVKTYSLGMKQKLALAQAIMEKPKLLLLDEPTNALDEESVHQIRQVLLDLKESGSTIIIVSHNKEDINVLAEEKIHMVAGEIRREEFQH